VKKKSHKTSLKRSALLQKGNTNLSPARDVFKNRAADIGKVSSPIGIQTVVLQQSKDQPNQFSGS
jgi:hypothetical protein